jgi:hypothetical protein
VACPLLVDCELLACFACFDAGAKQSAIQHRDNVLRRHRLKALTAAPAVIPTTLFDLKKKVAEGCPKVEVTDTLPSIQKQTFPNSHGPPWCSSSWYSIANLAGSPIMAIRHLQSGVGCRPAREHFRSSH